jgi:Ca-activated chloride channel homolog
MKAAVPYLLLGLIGSVGAAVGTGVAQGGGAKAPPLPPPAIPAVPAAAAPVGAPAAGGPVLVHASLDRTALPQGGGEVFARIALEGVLPKGEERERVPVSLTLVIDRSGSMGSGNKMGDARRAAREALLSLEPGDRAAVVSFDDGAVFHGTAAIAGKQSGDKAPARDVRDLLRAIDGLGPRGGTDMISALEVGARAAATIHEPQRVNRLLLLSDGRPNTEVGLTDRVKRLLEQGVQTTTIGLGADYNEDLMAQLADAGLGRYHFVEGGEKLAGIFAEELKSLAAVVARDAMLELRPADGVSIEEVIGFRSDRSGGAVLVPAGDIYGGRTTDMLVRLRTTPGHGQRDVVNARVSFRDAQSGERGEERRQLAALFTNDERAIKASVVAEVEAKAETWRAAQAYVRADEAYNRGDQAAGDKILAASQARLEEKADAMRDAQLKASLKAEAQSQQAFQMQNAAGGAAWRGIGSKEAKKRAWSMNKGSAY